MEKPKKLFGAVDFAALEKRILDSMAQQRAQIKAAAHAGRYSVGPDAFLRGAQVHRMVFDEVTDFKTVFDEFGVDVDKHKLSIEEWRWAVALRRVYNVNAAFFEEQKPAKRADIIKKLSELAKKDNRSGRMAAQTVAIVVEMAIERREPNRRPKVLSTNDQMDAYRYMFGLNTPDELKKEPK